MPTPLLITLIAFAALVAVAVAAILAVRFAAPVIVKTSIGRRVLGKLAKFGMNAARKRAEREGTTTDATGARLSDAEIMLRDHGGEEARQMESMMAKLPPAQRAQARRMMDKVDIADVASQLDSDSDEGLSMGREAKRALERIADNPIATSGARALTTAQKKAKEKARAARKRSKRK